MYDFDDDDNKNNYPEDTVDDTPMYKIMTNNIMSMIVRGAGMLLLLMGMWMGMKTLNIILDLYQTPETIERFATKIEQGSGIDKAIAPAKEIIASTNSSTESNPNELQEFEAKPKKNSASQQGLRMSYFFAWAIVLILLLILGRLSLIAIKVGGELVLYDVQLRRFVKEILNSRS